MAREKVKTPHAHTSITHKQKVKSAVRRRQYPVQENGFRGGCEFIVLNQSEQRHHFPLLFCLLWEFAASEAIVKCKNKSALWRRGQSLTEGTPASARES